VPSRCICVGIISKSSTCRPVLVMRHQESSKRWGRTWIGKRVATVPSFSLNKYGVGEEAIVPANALGEYLASSANLQKAIS